MEEAKWKWSPLYQIFRRWPLRNFRNRPWDHTDGEWQEMSTVLLENTRREPLSLEQECPHILRALLYLVRTLQGHRRPLSHPITGVDQHFLLNVAHDTHLSVTLTSVAGSLPILGWTIFPGMQNAADNFEQLFSDVAALLGYDPSRKMAVIEKIESFVGWIALRAIADMVRMHRKDELADMWYTGDIRPDQNAKLEEIRSLYTYFTCVLHLQLHVYF